MTINYDINQALIKLKAAVDNLEEVMNNPEKVNSDERWKLAHKFPFSEDIESIKLRVASWVEAHYVMDKDEAFKIAMEEATKVFGVDPAYFGEEGQEEVVRQLKKLGFTLADYREDNN